MTATEVIAEVVEGAAPEAKATERVRSPFPSTLFYGVTLTGNITRDPVIRFTTSGRAVLNTALAINQRRRQESGEWVDSQPAYVDLIMYGPSDGSVGQLDNVMQSVKTGLLVTAVGDFRNRQWSTEDGRKRTAAEMLCSDIAVNLRFVTAEVTKTAGRPVVVEEPF